MIRKVTTSFDKALQCAIQENAARPNLDMMRWALALAPLVLEMGMRGERPKSADLIPFHADLRDKPYLLDPLSGDMRHLRLLQARFAVTRRVATYLYLAVDSNIGVKIDLFERQMTEPCLGYLSVVHPEGIGSFVVAPPFIGHHHKFEGSVE